MDNSPHYRVVFAGRLLDGFAADEVKQSLASQLRLSPAKVVAFFSGEKQVLKRTVTLEQAQRYVTLFTGIGLATAVETLGKSESDDRADDDAPQPEARPLPPLRPVRSNLLYKPLLGLAALCNMAMFLLYLATLATLLLVLLNPYALAAWLFASLDNPLLASAVYALTLVFGLLFTALLAKPLLSLRRAQYPTVALSQEQEPDLFEFVADVCETVGTAPPREILLSNDATLDMRFQDDVTAVIEGRTTLILGLPLVAGLNVRQLAAALAQTAYGWGPHRGARTARFLQRYTAWLLRAGDGSDFVARRLLRWQRRTQKNRYLVDSLLRLCRWARLPLALNLWLNRLLAGRAFQRRVADADAAARRLAGNADFRRMLEQSRVLTHAAQRTIPALRRMWRDRGEVPDNIAMAVVAQASTYPASIHDQLRSEQELHTPARDALLPSDRQRLRHLDLIQEEGSYRCRSAGAVVFQRFDKLMHNMTMRYYHRHLGLPVTTNKLIRTPVKGSQEYHANNYIACYFGTLYADLVPIKLARRLKELRADGDAAVRHWQLALTLIEKEKAKAKAALTTLHQADDDLVTVSNRELLHRAARSYRLRGAPLLGRHTEQVHQTCRNYENRYDAAMRDADKAVTPYVGRLAAALALLGRDDVTLQLAGAEALRGETDKLLQLSEKIEGVYPQLQSLRLATLLLESLLSDDSRRGQRRLRDLIVEKCDDIHRLLQGLDVSLRQAQFPFRTRQNYRNLMHWAQLTSLPGNDAGALFDRGTDTVRNLLLLQRFIVGRLSAIALQVEKAYALKVA